MPMFRVGDLVALRSDPATIVPVIEVLPGNGECRYRVFQNGAKATYYESQLQPPAATPHERRTLTADEMRAALTSLHILSPSTANLFSLRSGRVEFVPCQYRPVLKLIRSDRRWRPAPPKGKMHALAAWRLRHGCLVLGHARHERRIQGY